VADPVNLDPRFYDHRDLFIETLARTAPLAHRSVLPRALTASLISSSEQTAIAFVLSFIEDERLRAPLLISGGYVRDLLLGKAPDDLDLSLCLRDCPPDITLVRVMALMEPFARSRPDLNVSSVKVSVAHVDVPPPQP